MAVSARSRSLIDPFNEKVRDRIFGSRISNASSTSGSEHDADLVFSSSSSTYSSSPRLSYLVQNFLENADVAGDLTASNEAGDSEEDSVSSDPTVLMRELADPIARRNSDRFIADLLAHVSTAAEMFSLLRRNPTAFNRNVMVYLRGIGYNAGVCKAKWEAASTNGLIAGSYEFIDVVRSENSSRFVVDLNFAAQFEIARETDRFRSVLGALPRVFVGKSDDLKRIVKITADEMKRSMKINEMSLPPWRKYQYMLAKWFGPYHRTVNQLPTSAAESQLADVMSISAVKCRSVGFFSSAVDGGGRFVVAPPTTRTR